MNPDDLMYGMDFHRESGDLANWLITEKFDGQRVRWEDGKLWIRHGNLLSPPKWFTADLPESPLDAELWAGYGNRGEVNRLLASSTQDWNGMTLKIFDAPAGAGDFGKRHAFLRGHGSYGPHAEVVWCSVLMEMEALPAWLKSVTLCDGRGLVLHKPGWRYCAGRSCNLLKFKSASLAEFHARDPGTVAV